MSNGYRPSQNIERDVLLHGYTPSHQEARDLPARIATLEAEANEGWGRIVEPLIAQNAADRARIATLTALLSEAAGRVQRIVEEGRQRAESMPDSLAARYTETVVEPDADLLRRVAIELCALSPPPETSP